MGQGVTKDKVRLDPAPVATNRTICVKPEGNVTGDHGRDPRENTGEHNCSPGWLDRNGTLANCEHDRERDDQDVEVDGLH